MQVFTTPEGKFKDIADKYRKTGETIRISMPIEYQGKKYREIVYNKTLLGKMKKNIVGVIFVSEDGEYVSQSGVKNELTALGYHFEVLLDDKNINDLKKAMISELETEKQLIDNKQIIIGIENMKTEEIKGIEIVVQILNKLPNLKKENNKIIETYTNQAQLINPEGFVFSVSEYNNLYPYYREILVRNFQKVKLVATGRKFYDDIKREAQKRKRNIAFRLNHHDVFMGITKIPYEMDHLKRIVSVYERVADMKQEEYLKYLKSIEKTNISDRVGLVR